jgi:alpha-tubulin suppressor-like RCC1 family protein
VLTCGVLAAACSDPASPTSLRLPASVQHATLVTPRVTAGAAHTCAVRSTGIIECWGRNNEGQAPASRSATTGAFVQADGGAFHTCALTTEGTAQCWGSNFYRQAPAARQAASGTFVSVSAGVNHTCALRIDGIVECWGSDNEGQAPEERAALAGSFTQVSTNGYHTCALRDDGAIECWGRNVEGQAPATVTAATGAFVAVAGGGYHTCGLRSDGVAECWGLDANGQAPVSRAASGASFSSLDAGGWHSCGLRTDGAIECWGNNADEQAPASMTAASGHYSQVSTGGNHSCALWGGDIVECWGLNNHGQAAADHSPVEPLNLYTIFTSASELDVSWQDHSTNETEFQLERRTYSAGAWGTWTLVSTLAAGITSFTDTDVSDANGYQYRVRACNHVGCSVWTSELPPVTWLPLVATLVDLTQVDLSWPDNPNENWYELERRGLTGESWTAWQRVATPGVDVIVFSDSDVVEGTSYQYRLRACNMIGCSSWARSTEVVVDVAPADPAGVHTAVTLSNDVEVLWTDASANEQSFVVMRRWRDGSNWLGWERVTTTAANASSHTDTSVVAEQTYQYRVKACNRAGCSSWATSSRVLVLARPAPAESAIATPVSATEIHVVWTDASSNEAWFYVDRRSSVAGTWTAWQLVHSADVDATAFSDVEVAPGTLYQYRVRACNNAGCAIGAISNRVTTPGI